MDLIRNRATPWYVGEMNDHGIRVAPVADPRNAVAYAFDEDDAAFIVRAVNSHDALTAAGKRLADVAEACARGDDEAVPESLRNLTQQDVADAINAMRVALTAATEQREFAFGDDAIGDCACTD